MKKSQLRNIIREVIMENHYNQNLPAPTSPVGCECTHAFGHPTAKSVTFLGEGGYMISPGDLIQPVRAPQFNVTVNGRRPLVGDIVFLRSATNTCTGAKIRPPDSQQPWFNGNNHQMIKVISVEDCLGEWFNVTNHPDGSQTQGLGDPYNDEVFTLPPSTPIGGTVIDYRTVSKKFNQDPEVPKTKR